MKRIAMTVLAATWLVAASMPRARADYQFTTIDPPGIAGNNAGGGAVGINNLGQIVEAYYDPATYYLHGYLLSGGVYSAIDSGAPQTSPQAINDRGQIVGYSADSTGHPTAFLLSGGTFTSILPPGATYSDAYGINASGDVVGSAYDPSYNSTGYLLHNGVFTSISAPGAASTYLYGLNATDQIIGLAYYSSGQETSFLLSGGVYTTIAVPGAANTIAYGINDLGQIVGLYNDPLSNVSHGFLLSNGVYTTIDDPNAGPTYGYTSIDGINDNGTIVGQYFTDQFQAHGFVAQSVPEPGTMALLAIGGGMLVAIARKKGRSGPGAPSGRGATRGLSPTAVRNSLGAGSRSGRSTGKATPLS